MTHLPLVHLVDSSSARRARFAGEIIKLGMHAEIYDSVEELCRVSSVRGVAYMRQVAILQNDDEANCIGESVHALGMADCHHPVIAFTVQQPCSRRIVAAIQGGALDYICFPDDLPVLGDRIADLITRARQLTRSLERRMQAIKRLAQLTGREREVLQATIEGATSKETAAQLGLSHRTVEVHRAAILYKLGVSTSAAAIAVGVAAGMLDFGAVLDGGLPRAA
jgi:FixJ family two-component response regulator